MLALPHTFLKSLGCFYSQNKLAKIPGYGPTKPCQTCKIFELYNPETYAVNHRFIGSPLFTFMINIWKFYSMAIFSHIMNIDIDVTIVIKFPKKYMVNTNKSPKKNFFIL